MKEADIRPVELFDRYLALCRQDAVHFFRPDEWELVVCPACGAEGHDVFVKHAFHYRVCDLCDTLFASPRPTAAGLARYYTEAESVRFWASDFYRETEHARRERMFRPRAELVVATAGRLASGTGIQAVVDIGAGYGVFCEEIHKVLPAATVCAVEPSPALAAVCRDKGLTVVEAFLEDLRIEDLPPRGGLRVFTSFELFEHLHTPADFLRTVRAQMGPQDLLILSTLSGTGFDIRVLWQESKAIFPPHHLNFLNPWSLSALAARCELDVVEVTTPGKLDVDIVANNLALACDQRFVGTIFRHATDAARQDLQRWLQENNLSSHMMLVARRVGD
jgi:2-polyprenyl-3-methyl-5-hydroxy-6-metoxy-1,4-benzoquinol methylase